MDEALGSTGGSKLIMNKKAFKSRIERYRERHLLKEYTSTELMNMI
jgi:hypothetical protein